MKSKASRGADFKETVLVTNVYTDESNGRFTDANNGVTW
jgi:hypothetical protein